MVSELTEPLRTYVSYSLECVQRGRLAMEEIRPYRALQGIRYLDAGCAYGGFLVAAAEAGAREVVGVDVDDRLLGVARPFLEASSIPHRVEKGDVSDPAVLGPLGRFDLITCNDVVEHVDNVPRLISTLAAGVAEGGCLYIAAPNRRSPTFIRSDPHFQLFGIVLLPREPARRFARIWTSYDGYDVGQYFELPFYRELLERQGLEVEVINVPEGPPRDRVAELERQFQEIEAKAAAWNEAVLPEELNAELRMAVGAAVKGFRDRVDRLRALEEFGDEAAADVEAAGIVRDYEVAVWHIVARRPDPQVPYVTEPRPKPSFVGRVRRKLAADVAGVKVWLRPGARPCAFRGRGAGGRG